jgi:hypothetical protein
MIENALLWNGNCSAYIKGESAFYTLIDSSLEPKPIWKYSEQIQQELAHQFVEKGEVTAFDLAEGLK